jgi:hypothetical protein
MKDKRIQPDGHAKSTTRHLITRKLKFQWRASWQLSVDRLTNSVSRTVFQGTFFFIYHQPFLFLI